MYVLVIATVLCLTNNSQFSLCGDLRRQFYQISGFLTNDISDALNYGATKLQYTRGQVNNLLLFQSSSTVTQSSLIVHVCVT